MKKKSYVSTAFECICVMRSNILFILHAILLYLKKSYYVRKGNKKIWKKEWKQIKFDNAAKLGLGCSCLSFSVVKSMSESQQHQHVHGSLWSTDNDTTLNLFSLLLLFCLFWELNFYTDIVFFMLLSYERVSNTRLSN